MKKYLFCLLFGLFVVSFASCNNQENPNESVESTLETNLVNNVDYICHDGSSINNNEAMWYINSLEQLPLSDPHIYEEKGTYYMVGTTGFNVACYTTKDFITYKYRGEIYNPNWYGSWENPAQALFAPELYCFDGIYYLYYSALDENYVRKNSVVYATSPLGPYKPIVNETVDGKNNPVFLDQNVNNPVLDASVFQDDDGLLYMYYSVGNAEGQYIVGVKLNNPYTADWSTYTELVKAGYYDSTFKIKFFEWEEYREIDQIVEAPCMIKSNGKYYLTYSVNGCWNKYYNVCYAISDTPLGNFKKPYQAGKKWSNLLLGYPGDNNKDSLVYQQWNGFTSGTGYHCFFKIGNQVMIGYHAHKNRNWNSDSEPTMRYFAMDYVFFDEKGVPFCNGPTWSVQPLPAAISGYQNIAINSQVKSKNVKNSQYINDNYIEDCYNLIYGNGKEVVLTGEYSYIELVFDKEYEIGGISIYNSSFYNKMIDEIVYIDFGEGNVVLNPQFPIDKYSNKDLEFIYPSSAFTIEFKKIFTAKKVVICFKTNNESNINEVKVFGK